MSDNFNFNTENKSEESELSFQRRIRIYSFEKAIYKIVIHGSNLTH